MITNSKSFSSKEQLNFCCLFDLNFLSIQLLDSLRNFSSLHFASLQYDNWKTDSAYSDVILVDITHFYNIERYSLHKVLQVMNKPLILLLKEEQSISQNILCHTLIDGVISVNDHARDTIEQIKNCLGFFSKQPENNDSILKEIQQEVQLKKSEFLQNVNSIIESSSELHQVSTEEIAARLHISSAALRRRIKKITGMTTVQYVLHYRLETAKKLIEYEGCNVQESATKTGFLSLSYFTKCFKQTFGVNPSSYHLLCG